MNAHIDLFQLLGIFKLYAVGKIINEFILRYFILKLMITKT